VRLAVCALAVALALGCGGARAGTRHLHVLFVGNSLTSTNDLPATVAAFAHAVGHVEVDVKMVAPGGYALEDHWTDGVARAALDAGGWDVVVMQQGPSSLPDSRVNLIEWAKRWSDDARAHGTRPALLTVWPEGDRYSVFPAVIANYAAAAKAARAASFPAGAAWVDAARRQPGLRLYGPDGFHPSRLGTYLTAAVVYTGLTGELPRALPRDIAGTHLGVRVARTLRASVGVAYRAVKAP
jgi:hypothetical protein